MEEVRDWLGELHLLGFANVFQKKGFDCMEGVLHMDEQDIMDIFDKPGHRKLVRESINKLRMRINLNKVDLLKSSMEFDILKNLVLAENAFNVQDFKISFALLTEIERKINVGHIHFLLGVLYHKSDDIRLSEHYFVLAIQQLDRKASEGDPESLYNLGVVYEHGYGIGEDIEKAIKFYTAAADKDHAGALYALGLLYDDGHGVAEDKKTAMRYFMDAAENGHPEAQCTVGIIYDNDCWEYGIDADKSKAIKFFKLAADQGLAKAQWCLAVIYHTASGYQDLKLALKYYQMAAEAGVAGAQWSLGYLYDMGDGVPQDKEKAFKYYLAAANQGWDDAQYSVARSYELGEGVPANPKLARKYYKLSAEQGNVDAIYRMANFYEHGEGFPEDKEKAIKYYQSAADLGHVDAIFKIAYLNDYGEAGLEVDKEKAVKYYQMAADLGHVDAQFNTAYSYEQGEGVPENKEIALKYYQLAADQGNGDAQFKIAYCYDTGEDVEVDKPKAVKYYQLAADQGNGDAQYNIGFCYETGDGVQKNLELALKYYRMAAAKDIEGAAKKVESLIQPGSKSKTTKNDDRRKAVPPSRTPSTRSGVNSSPVHEKHPPTTALSRNQSIRTPIKSDQYIPVRSTSIRSSEHLAAATSLRPKTPTDMKGQEQNIPTISIPNQTNNQPQGLRTTLTRSNNLTPSTNVRTTAKPVSPRDSSPVTQPSSGSTTTAQVSKPRISLATPVSPPGTQSNPPTTSTSIPTNPSMPSTASLPLSPSSANPNPPKSRSPRLSRSNPSSTALTDKVEPIIAGFASFDDIFYNISPNDPRSRTADKTNLLLNLLHELQLQINNITLQNFSVAEHFPGVLMDRLTKLRNYVLTAPPQTNIPKPNEPDPDIDFILKRFSEFDLYLASTPWEPNKNQRSAAVLSVISPKISAYGKVNQNLGNLLTTAFNERLEKLKFVEMCDLLIFVQKKFSEFDRMLPSVFVGDVARINLGKGLLEEVRQRINTIGKNNPKIGNGLSDGYRTRMLEIEKFSKKKW